MYVVAMAAKDARQYMTSEQLNPNNGISDTFIKKLKTMDNDNQLKNSKSEYDEGTEINLGSGIVARVWKFVVSLLQQGIGNAIEDSIKYRIQIRII